MLTNPNILDASSPEHPTKPLTDLHGLSRTDLDMDIESMSEFGGGERVFPGYRCQGRVFPCPGGAGFATSQGAKGWRREYPLKDESGSCAHDFTHQYEIRQK